MIFRDYMKCTTLSIKSQTKSLNVKEQYRQFIIDGGQLTFAQWDEERNRSFRIRKITRK